jgi:hypothetical protein
VRGARAARLLARQCHLLAQPGYESTIGAEEWQEEWLFIRGEALAMLAPVEPGAARVPDEAQDSTSAPSLEHFEHEALTRAVEWEEETLSPSERPTRIPPPGWPVDDEVARRL